MLDAHAVVLSPIEALFLNLSLLCIVAWPMWIAGKSLRPGNDLAMLALLALFATSGRILLDPLPNIQPVTVVVLLVGAHYGASRSVAFASVVAISSNLVLGHGIWTLYQALAWSLVGITGSSLSRIFRNGNSISIRRVGAVAFVAGFAFDWVVSISALHSIPLESFPVYLMVGLPFDLVHATGNLVFAAWLSGPLSEIMTRQSPQSKAVVEPVKNTS